MIKDFKNLFFLSLLWVSWIAAVIYFSIIQTHVKTIPQAIIVILFFISAILQVVRYPWISKGVFLFVTGFVFFIAAWRLSDELHYLANPVVHQGGHYVEPEFFVYGPFIGVLAALAGCVTFYGAYSRFEKFPRFSALLLSAASIVTIIYDKFC